MRQFKQPENEEQAMSNAESGSHEFPHPIGEEAVERATGTYAEVTPAQVEEVHVALTTVQRVLEEQISNLVEEGIWYDPARSGPERNDVDFLEESKQAIYLEVSEIPWENIFEDAHLDDRTMQYVVRDAHNHHAREYFEIDEWPERLTDDREATDGGVMVIQKPSLYTQAEDVARNQLWWLIEYGFDADKVLDYWMVEHQGFDVEAWAETRGEKTAVIETNVKLIGNETWKA